MLQRETLSNGVKHPERLNHCIIYALDHLDKASRNNRQVYKEIEKDDYMRCAILQCLLQSRLTCHNRAQIRGEL